MVSVVCIGAVLLAAGELMFAWTCTPNVHWIWPLIAGSEFAFLFTPPKMANHVLICRNL